MKLTSPTKSLVASLVCHEGNFQYYPFISGTVLPKEAREFLTYWDAIRINFGVDVFTTAKSFYDYCDELVGMEEPSVEMRAIAEAIEKEPGTGDTTIIKNFIDKYYMYLIGQQAATDSNPLHLSGGEELTKIFEEWMSVQRKLERGFESSVPVSDLEKTLTESIAKEGLSWPLSFLQDTLGPFSDQLIILAARPDGGKTTMLAQIASHVARHNCEDGECVLWFLNEEAMARVMFRVVSHVTGSPQEIIEADLAGHLEQYRKAIGDRIVFVDDADSIDIIEKNIKKFNPRLVLIDQLYKVTSTTTRKNENDVERFRKLAEWARNIGKHTAPVIATNQLDFSAEGEKYPTMDKLYGSKTGLQGEADAIIMLGREMSDPDTRYIWTPKNKLTGKVKAGSLTLFRDIATFREK